eukprot:2027256-Ditylum_brightwellii.AAC.1
MSGDGNEPSNDFKAYHTTDWYQWELNIQMLTKGAIQLNAANNAVTNTKALLIKLLAVHGKDNINVFAKTKRRLEVENFPKDIKETKDLLAYETSDGRYKNAPLILHATGLIPIGTLERQLQRLDTLLRLILLESIMQHVKSS